MVYNLEDIYENQYNEYEYSTDSLSINEDDLDMPTGWSFICFDETINYYTNLKDKS
uniref:Uncharacterized protein n=1 Tax=Sonderella linearis TaxID=110477 RepID=A0A1Z1MMC0_9FLOR|nr:hypothetical protein [Sonderella linearis]ARW67012.1 hypothetical protein [Sonderella linearis]